MYITQHTAQMSSESSLSSSLLPSISTLCDETALFATAPELHSKPKASGNATDVAEFACATACCFCLDEAMFMRLFAMDLSAACTSYSGVYARRASMRTSVSGCMPALTHAPLTIAGPRMRRSTEDTRHNTYTISVQ